MAHAVEQGEVGPPSEPSKIIVDGDSVHYIVPNSTLLQMEDEAPSWLLIEFILEEGEECWMVWIEIPSSALREIGTETMIDTREEGNPLSLKTLGLSQFASEKSLELSAVTTLHDQKLLPNRCEPDKICYDKFPLVCSTTEVVDPAKPTGLAGLGWHKSDTPVYFAPVDFTPRVVRSYDFPFSTPGYCGFGGYGVSVGVSFPYRIGGDRPVDPPKPKCDY